MRISRTEKKVYPKKSAISKRRPLTEEEKEEQLAPIKELTPLDPGIQVDSDLESVYSAYGERGGIFRNTYDARQRED
ncbi:MAG: hypothetical protein ACLUTA_14605 [Blautia wexlerae]